METTTWVRFCELRTSAVMGVIVVCLLQMLKPVTTASNEIDTHSVNVSLYLTTLEEWRSNVQNTFETTVAAQATSYCSDNLPTCGLTNIGSGFSKTDVTYKREATYVKPELSFKYGLKLPADSSKVSGANTDYLNLEALKTITINSRSKLSGSDNVDLSVIGSTNYGPVPDAVTNGVICAVAAAIVLALIATVCILNAKCTQGSKRPKRPNPEQGSGPHSEGSKTSKEPLETKNATTPL